MSVERLKRRAGPQSRSQRVLADFFRREVSVKLWIEGVLSISLPKNFLPSLHNGVILCKLMLSLKERSIPLLSEPEDDDQELPFFKSKNNISFFLAACEEEFRIPRRAMFEIHELYGCRNIVKIINTLVLLGFRVRSALPHVFPYPVSLEPEVVVRERYATPPRARAIVEQLDCEKKRMSNAIMKTHGLIPEQVSKQAIALEPTLSASASSLSIEQVIAITPGIVRLQALVRGYQCRRQVRKLVRNEAYRQNVARELLSTELSYNSAMQQLNTKFLSSLCEGDVDTFPQLKPLYSITQIIVGYSTVLLSTIQPRVEAWTRRERLGDVFLTLSDYLKVYTQYLKLYEPCLARLEELKSDESILPILQTVATKAEKPKILLLTFESYLIMPVQRIPRYEMLLKDLLKHTDEDHPDHDNLVKAFEKIRVVAAYVNDNQKEFEARAKVIEISQMFGTQLEQGTGVSQFIRSHRRLVRSDTFVGPSSKILTCFCLNDLLVFGTPNTKKKKKYKLKALFHITNICITAKGKHNLELRSADQSIAFFSASSEVITSWKEEVLGLQAELKKAIATEEPLEDSSSKSKKRHSTMRRSLSLTHGMMSISQDSKSRRRSKKVDPADMATSPRRKSNKSATTSPVNSPPTSPFHSNTTSPRSVTPSPGKPVPSIAIPKWGSGAMPDNIVEEMLALEKEKASSRKMMPIRRQQSCVSSRSVADDTHEQKRRTMCISGSPSQSKPDDFECLLRDSGILSPRKERKKGSDIKDEDADWAAGSFPPEILQAMVEMQQKRSMERKMVDVGPGSGPALNVQRDPDVLTKLIRNAATPPKKSKDKPSWFKSLRLSRKMSKELDPPSTLSQSEGNEESGGISRALDSLLSPRHRSPASNQSPLRSLSRSKEITIGKPKVVASTNKQMKLDDEEPSS